MVVKHSVPQFWVSLSAEGAKTFPGPGYLCSEDEIVWLWHSLVNLDIYSSPLYLAMAQSQYLVVNGRDGGLSNLYQSCRFACQQKMLKTFPGYLQSKDGIVWSDYGVSW